MKYMLSVLLQTAILPAARAQTSLETDLLAAVQADHFEGVIDFGAGNESRPVRDAMIKLSAAKP